MMTEQHIESVNRAFDILCRVSAQKSVAEAKLRMAAELVATKIATLIGEPSTLSRGYVVVDLDPQSQFLDHAPRKEYLVLVHQRLTSASRTKSYALSTVAKGAQDAFDFPPAGRLTLTKFAHDLQTGLLDELAETMQRRAERMEAALPALETMGKVLA